MQNTPALVEKNNMGTDGRQVHPDFLVVGAAKAGSTSLYHWLKQHPDVFMPEWKEPCYFVNNYGVREWDEYISLFQPGRDKKAIGEASATYLANPISPQWIFDKLGDVKIIIVLRNPTDRSFSLYRHGLQYGYETIPTFEGALTEEEARLGSETFKDRNPHYYLDYAYFNTGLYYEQVKRYLDIFSCVKIYLFEDLVGSSEQTYKDLCMFLDIDNSFLPDFKHHNASIVPRFIKAQYMFRQHYKAHRFQPGIFAQIVSRFSLSMMNLNLKLGVDLKLPSERKDKLKAAYREDIIKLSALLNRDLSMWM